jgi:hypothetical protein
MREITIGAAAALTAALLATGPAEANDRGLKGTTVNPFSCMMPIPSGFVDDEEWFRTIGSYGIGFYADAPDTGMSLHCPLPVNNVDLGTSSNDNDMSSFTVAYSDVDDCDPLDPDHPDPCRGGG